MLATETLSTHLPHASQKHKTSQTTHTRVPHFTRLEALLPASISGLSAGELRIKLPETLEVVSPAATAPTQKQSLSLQLLRALTSKLNSCFCGKPQTP